MERICERPASCWESVLQLRIWSPSQISKASDRNKTLASRRQLSPPARGEAARAGLKSELILNRYEFTPQIFVDQTA